MLPNARANAHTNRAGRVLGRCHAQLGESVLSAGAFDAALDGARKGGLLYSEALTVRARALVSRGSSSAGSGSGSSSGGSGSNGSSSSSSSSSRPPPHWSEETGRQRLAEVIGRMSGEKQLLEKLLLHGLLD